MRNTKIVLVLLFAMAFVFAAAQKKSKDQLFKELGSTTDSTRAMANWQLAKMYLRISLDSAAQWANTALTIAQKMGNKKIEAESYGLLGAVQKNRGQYEAAIAYHLKALSIKEKTTDDYGISITLNDIGIVYKNIRRYKEAMEYYKRSLLYATKAKQLKSIALVTNNIGTVFSETNRYDSARYYLNRALPVAKQSGDSNALVTVLSNLGEVYANAKNYPDALINFYQCLSIDKVFEDNYGMIVDYSNIGGCLIKLRQYDKARPFLDSAYNIADKEGFAMEKANVLNSLVTYYTAKGDLEKAEEISISQTAIKDSIQNLDIQKNISELSAKYETAKKEKQLQEERFENTKKQYWIIGLLGLLALGGLLGYSYYKRYTLANEKRLQLAVIAQQDITTKAIIEAEENERKRIAGDLHDGVGQIMSAAKMNLSSIESRLNFNTEQDRQTFEKIVHLVDESCKEVRAVSHNMMPNALLKTGLSNAVKDFIDKIDSRLLKVNLYSEGLNERLDSNVETVLYRVIQECVNNVIKHSGANELDISLIKDTDGIAATIEDNGKGFVVTENARTEGIGLKNIRTRIGYLKGTVDFDSAPGKGTLVAIHVPL